MKTIPLDDIEGWRAEGTAFAETGWQSYLNSFESLGPDGFVIWRRAVQGYLTALVVDMAKAAVTPAAVNAFSRSYEAKIASLTTPYLATKAA